MKCLHPICSAQRQTLAFYSFGEQFVVSSLYLNRLNPKLRYNNKDMSL